MLKSFSYIIYLTLKYLNSVFYLLTRRNFLGWLAFFLLNNSYEKKKINNKEINFYVPNHLISWRVRTILDKEPDTIEWIRSFKKYNLNKQIFWDIGANIGLYSIFFSSLYDSGKVFAFEPSTSNLRVLSRNIYINGYQNQIFINQLALSNKNNLFLSMKENDFQEGVSLNTFGENFDFEGKQYLAKNEYNILGCSIDYLIDNKIMEIPDFIKIDVDGIEHLILQGGKKTLLEKKIKSVLIEINENFYEQKNQVENLMLNSGYKFIKKDMRKKIPVSEKFSKTFNYIYER